MLRKKITKTVSEKISDILTRNANGQDESSSDDEQSEEPRVEDEFDEYDLPDARSTDIRKRNVKLLSEQSAKYRGKISTRNELEEEEESDSTDDGEKVDGDSEDDGEEVALKAFRSKLEADEGSGGEHSENDDGGNLKWDDDSEDSECNESREHDDYDEEGDEENDDDDTSGDEEGIESEDDNSETEQLDANDIIAETNRQAEVQKGQCVQNQLKMWERLLEMRIRTQKVLSKSNQLPTPAALKSEQEQNEKLASVCNQTVDRVGKLLTTLLQLQKACSEQFTEQRAALKKTLKRTLPTTGDNSGPPPLKRFADHLNAHFQEFKLYRNTVLLKWDDRTKLLTPGAGAKKKSLNEDYDILRKIENTLQSRAALIKHSQTVKAGDEAGVSDGDDDEQTKNAAAEHAQTQRLNVELYDDSDFYHSQLRELIEYKTSTSVSASEVTQQYVELQKLRQKMKKKVDTRASKGRKLRYTVHNKLVNFMAPDDTTTWTEESKDELYRSLFSA